ncbi:MAG: Unknown protein [uncultured Sulfurovum sp.]|uniref:SPOR domain-containing protein n=1 Tax=uncultured Sulfurovum sp. TaxID=269237 RepID=A0A6S6SNR6_9BACT|nr:MAG: Unknown protein [uncultured Sulfurovum sp.]
MKKLILFITLLFYSTTLFGDDSAYNVKVGVFKNSQKLRQNIAKIKPSKYKKYLVIEKKNNLNYVYAPIKSNIEAKKALDAYKQIFKDAYITKRKIVVKEKKDINKKILEKKQKNHTNTKVKKLPKINPNVQKKYKVKRKHIDLSGVLENNTFYLCLDETSAISKNRIAKMSFDEESVSYFSNEYASTPLSMEYHVYKDMVKMKVNSLDIVHIFNSLKEEKYYLVQSFIGKKKSDVLRYYLHKEDAYNYMKKNKK